ILIGEVKLILFTFFYFKILITMLRNTILFVLVILSFQGWSQSQPNIIVFLIDDMGWMDTSVPFGEQRGALNQRFHTPNMERLALEGMKFTNAYATPVCTPSRVSLMSGMN